MDEEWRFIEDFPRYSVSNHGRVVNRYNGRSVALTRNQRGIVVVGLNVNGIQHKVSLAKVVAWTFNSPPVNSHYDSILHLDGDRDNCRADNIVWRTRSFVIRYNRDIVRPPLPDWHGEIILLQTQEVFSSPREAARAYGLLEMQVMLSATGYVGEHLVYPGRLQFRMFRK